MDNYSIDEILSAIEQIQNRKNDIKKKKLITQSLKQDYSDVPKQTLKLIEEAEETK